MSEIDTGAVATDYEPLLESINSAAFVVDEARTLVYANDPLCERVEQPPEALAGAPATVVAEALFAGGEDTGRVEVVLDALAADEHDEYPVGVEFATDDAGGRATLQVSPLRADATDAGAVLVVDSNATDRREREQYEEIVEASQDVLWMFSADWSTCHYVNSQFEEVWGMEPERLYEDATNFLKTVHPEDHKKVYASMEEVSNGKRDNLEFRVHPAPEETNWVWVQAEPILKDGEPVCIAGFTRDITARKEREQALERARKRLSVALEAASAGVWELAIDSNDLTLHESRENQIVADHSGETDPVAALLEQVHPDDYDALESTITSAIEEGEDFSHEYRIIHEDGQTRWWEADAKVLTDSDGEPERLIGVSVDITNRKERERHLEESNERLERFAYVASHDLQEPLRTVANYVDILAADYEERLDEEAMELIDIAVTATERMDSMINALLDYSRVTTRGAEFEAVDAENVVDDIIDDLGVMLDGGGIEVTYEPLPTVEADRDQLRQLFQNLVKNAYEHAESESVAVEISGEEQPNQYRFEVSDDGPGIQESQQEKVFRMFKSTHQYQTESQAKGVGLAICDNIVQRHGGEITVESPPDEGATFVFTLDKQPGGDSR